MSETEYDVWQNTLAGKTWIISAVPFYEKGKAPKIEDWHNLDYLDVYHKIYGRKCGSNGIGRLKEAGLTRINEFEIYQKNPIWKQDPEYWMATGLGGTEPPNLEKWKEQHENYAKILRENGVKVHWIDFPEPPMSAYGPMSGMWAAAELLILNGGSIIPKFGWQPTFFGRAEFLARWAFWNLGIPPILAITGKGVGEFGASIFIAEEVFVTALSAAYNQEGIDQLTPVLRRTSGTEDFHTIILRMPTEKYFDPQTGASAHPDMVLAPLDIGKVLLFPSGVDTETFKWLRENRFEIIECDYQEQLTAFPCNLTILQPGKVIMHSAAEKSVAKVRAAGVDVVEAELSELLKMGGGMCCATMLILRERGPSLREIKK